jgi:hypothetical protein
VSIFNYKWDGGSPFAVATWVTLLHDGSGILALRK